jgi:hypothetical protein
LPRPLSVTIISALVIVYGLYTLALKVTLVSSPEAYAMFEQLIESYNAEAAVKLPLAFHLTYSFLGSVAFLVAGVFMLMGRNWARWLLLLWGLATLALTLALAGFSLPMYLKTATYLVFLYLLLRKNSVAYFKGEAAP